MICFWENTFWVKTSLSFVFRGSNSAHPEVFSQADCNDTSFKAVWWSVSEKTHFGLKHHFLLYLESQTQHTLRFSCMLITMVQVSTLYDDLFLKIKTHFGLKKSLSLEFRGPNSAHLEVFRHANHNWTSFKSEITSTCKKWTFMDVKLYDNATTCKEGIFLDLVCV